MKEEDQGDRWWRWQRGLSGIMLLIPHIRWNLTVAATQNKQLRKSVTWCKVHNVLHMRTSGWALAKCPQLSSHGTFADQRIVFLWGYKRAAEIRWQITREREKDSRVVSANARAFLQHRSSCQTKYLMILFRGRLPAVIYTHCQNVRCYLCLPIRLY